MMYWIAYCMIIPIAYLFSVKYRRGEHTAYSGLFASVLWPLIIIVEFVKVLMIILFFIAAPVNKVVHSAWEGLK